MRARSSGHVDPLRGGNIFESRANDSEELIMQTELKNSCDSSLLFQGK
jgi:hypothetical protein